jgi:hypothetical protein
MSSSKSSRSHSERGSSLGACCVAVVGLLERGLGTGADAVFLRFVLSSWLLSDIKLLWLVELKSVPWYCELFWPPVARNMASTLPAGGLDLLMLNWNKRLVAAFENCYMWALVIFLLESMPYSLLYLYTRADLKSYFHECILDMSLNIECGNISQRTVHKEVSNILKGKAHNHNSLFRLDWWSFIRSCHVFVRTVISNWKAHVCLCTIILKVGHYWITCSSMFLDIWAILALCFVLRLMRS